MKLLKENFEISDSLKNFLREHDIKVALNNDNFSYIYEQLKEVDERNTLTPMFTELMLKLGENPLEYMNHIPSHFLCKSNIAKIEIPSNITLVGDYAFESCYSLEEIDLSNCINLTHIGQGAFAHCKSLSNIKLPNSVVDIGFAAFQWCTSLTNINIPDSVSHIDCYAFYACVSLANIRLSDSLSNLDDCAFGGCSNLTKVDLSNCTKLDAIGEEEFVNCQNLTEVILPSSITTLETEAFYKCFNLKSVTISSDISTIGNGVFYGCQNLTLKVPKEFTSSK